MPVTVVNLRQSSFDVYGGREVHKNHHLGNPASHLTKGTAATVKVKTREESIQFHIDWLDGKYPQVEPQRRLYVLEQVELMKGKDLRIGCFCKPLPCHCDEYARRANEPR